MNNETDPPWFESEDSENSDDSDWFYDSLHRYERLYMYNLPLQPHCLAFGQNSLIALAGNSLQTTELYLYSIPNSISIPLENSCLNSNRDFSLLAGANCEKTSFTQISLWKEILVTLNTNTKLNTNKSTIQILTSWSKHSESDVLQKEKYFVFPKETRPKSFKIISQHVYVLVSNGLFVIELNNFTCIQKFFIEEELLAFDVDKENTIISVDVFGNIREKERIFQTIVVSPIVFVNQRNILTLHNDETFIYYTEDFTSYEHKRNLKKGENKCVSVAFSSKVHRFSYSTSSMIFVIELLSTGLSQIFTHDAHKSSIISHIWHPTLSNVILSTDSDCHLHLWQYKDNSE